MNAIFLLNFLVFGTVLVVEIQSLSAPRVATQKIVSQKYKWELDNQAMLDKSTFAIKPYSLIERCKEVVDKQIGIDCAEDLAEEFQFIFPVS